MLQYGFNADRPVSAHSLFSAHNLYIRNSIQAIFEPLRSWRGDLRISIRYRSLRSMWFSVGKFFLTQSTYLWVWYSSLLLYWFYLLLQIVGLWDSATLYLLFIYIDFINSCQRNWIVASSYFRVRTVRLQLHILLKFICLHINFNCFSTHGHIVGEM